MLDKYTINAPAKINLFLKILSKNFNNYHLINTGITFLNLSNKIEVSISKENELNYTGPFKPLKKNFDNDIIFKVLKFLDLKQKIKININKNIPSMAGLASASTDAASLIKCMLKMQLLNKIPENFLTSLGSDVPVCYEQKNCIVTGIGEKIDTKIFFPKYFFILIKPHLDLSSSEMYSKIGQYIKFNHKVNDIDSLNTKTYFNDFEKIIFSEYAEISNLIIFLRKLKNNVFAMMTGSGSCCYAAFRSKEDAEKNLELLSKEFPNYWITISENNSDYI